MKQIEIKVVTYTEKLESMKSIREKVFQVEQGVAPELEFDGLDRNGLHLLAYLNDVPIGTTRIRNLDDITAKIERLAVLPESRKQGIGKKLMEKAIELIAINDYETIIVYAQEYIKGFYQQLGFTQIGNRFEEAGISHVKMIKQLNTIVPELSETKVAI